MMGPYTSNKASANGSRPEYRFNELPLPRLCSSVFFSLLLAPVHQNHQRNYKFKQFKWDLQKRQVQTQHLASRMKDRNFAIDSRKEVAIKQEDTKANKQCSDLWFCWCISCRKFHQCYKVNDKTQSTHKLTPIQLDSKHHFLILTRHINNTTLQYTKEQSNHKCTPNIIYLTQSSNAGKNSWETEQSTHISKLNKQLMNFLSMVPQQSDKRWILYQQQNQQLTKRIGMIADAGFVISNWTYHIKMH